MKLNHSQQIQIEKWVKASYENQGYKMNRFFQLHHSTKSDQLCKLLVFYIYLHDKMLQALFPRNPRKRRANTRLKSIQKL